MAVTYLRLFPATQQFELRNGQLNVAGQLKVFYEGTDDLAAIYDTDGSQLPQPVILDDNGRSLGLFVDSKRVYRLEVYDRYGELIYTARKMVPSGGGAGSAIGNSYDVVSTDGSISVDRFDDGGVTKFDIGIAPRDSDEFLEWIKCSEEDCGSTWYPVYREGTMETEAGQGIKVHKGQLYHFTNTFHVDPDGTGIDYGTFTVNMYCNGSVVDSRNFDIDTSVNDAVQCEFSTDLIPADDGHVYFTLAIPANCGVTGEVQAHRIYSGINAVPDTCATKEWVQETFDYNLSSKVDYSAIEYNATGDITGISGSAIAASHVDPTVFVPWSASGAFAPSGDYAYNSSLSGYIPASASGMFQPSGNYQSAGDYAFNSAVSSKLDASASSYFVLNSSFSAFSSNVESSITAINSSITDIVNNVSSISGNMSSYVPFSGLEGDGMKITGISGSAIKGHEYTGINPVTVDNVNDTISVEHRTLCVDSTMTAYNSGNSAVIGVNVEGLNLSSKMDASASSMFYSTGNPSGFVDSSFVASAVSGKLDTTAFSTVSGDFLTSHQSLAGYATESYVDSAVSGKLDVTASSQFLTSLPDDLATTGDVASAVSGKLDNSASGEWYPMTGNPSAFLTAHQSLAGYATEQYVDSAVSSKLDASAYDSAKFYTTSNPSGFVGAASASAIASAYQVVSSLGSGIDSGVTYYTGINNNKIAAALATRAAYDLTNRELSSLPDSADVSAIASAYSVSAASSKLDASASSDFYSTSNPSGFLTSVDLTPYQLTADMSGYYTTANESGFVGSAYVEGQVSGKQDASEMTAYQEVSGMTAYQPSGDYIYASALGIAEV